METKASGKDEKEGAADFAAGFGRLAAEMLENARTIPVHPLMVHPAAAFAAATAIGFGFSTQMASAFFGALQGAMETTNKVAAALDEMPPKELHPEVAIRPENIKPVSEQPIARRVVSKPKLTVVSSVEKPVAQIKLVEPAKPVVARPKTVPRAKKADDLKLIAGIGPKLEQVLNEKGIRSFADIAAWTGEEIARIDAELGFGGRITRDDWAGQAKVLAARGRRKK